MASKNSFEYEVCESLLLNRELFGEIVSYVRMSLPDAEMNQAGKDINGAYYWWIAMKGAIEISASEGRRHNNANVTVWCVFDRDVVDMAKVLIRSLLEQGAKSSVQPPRFWLHPKSYRKLSAEEEQWLLIQ